jgi:RNA recognition motif-containing protein
MATSVRNEENLYEEIAKDSELQQLKKDFLELQKMFVAYKETTDTQIKNLVKNLELSLKFNNQSDRGSRCKVRITNYPLKYTQVKLYQYFAQFGTISNISIVQQSYLSYYADITYDSLKKMNELQHGNHILENHIVKIKMM